MRTEAWKAFDGGNTAIVNGSVKQANYQTHAQNLALSPKLALQKATDDNWIYKATIGRAYRFPTVTELFQAITVGNNLTVNNPDPETCQRAPPALN